MVDRLTSSIRVVSSCFWTSSKYMPGLSTTRLRIKSWAGTCTVSFLNAFSLGYGRLETLPDWKKQLHSPLNCGFIYTKVCSNLIIHTPQCLSLPHHPPSQIFTVSACTIGLVLVSHHPRLFKFGASPRTPASPLAGTVLGTAWRAYNITWLCDIRFRL